MADFRMVVTNVETGERIRDEECDMVLAVCVHKEEENETDRGHEEVLASSISLLGRAKAPYTLSAISAVSVAVKTLVGRAMERVAPIEWAARRDGLEKVRDALKASVERVEVLCAMAGAVDLDKWEEERHGPEVG